MVDCFHSSPNRHEQHMEESPVPFVIHELWQTGSADSAFGHTAHLQMGLLPWTCPCAGSRGFLKRHRAWEAALAEPCHVNCRSYFYAAKWAMFTASLPPSLSDMFTVSSQTVCVWTYIYVELLQLKLMSTLLTGWVLLTELNIIWWCDVQMVICTLDFSITAVISRASPAVRMNHTINPVT